MTVRNWNNAFGGLWSNSGNWTGSAPPVAGDDVTFASGTYTTIIDAGYLPGTISASLGDINLQAPGVTLDVQRSITVAQIDGDFSANGTANGDGLLEIGNGATVDYNPFGGSLVNTTNGNPGVGFYVKGDGVGARGSLVVGGSVDTGGTVIADGVNFDATVGITNSTAVVTLKNGAAWTAGASETFDVGTVNLAGGGLANFGALPAGALTFTGFVPTDQQVVMSGSNNELVLPNTADAKSLSIVNFGISDKIEVTGITGVRSATYDAMQHLNLFSGVNGTGTDLSTLTGVTLAAGLQATLGASHFSIGTDATGTFVDLVSCFTPGTRILTAEGEIDVEDLREGDTVLTEGNSGIEPRRIIWIGHRKIDLTRHPYPRMAAPIRIHAGAIAHGVPHRDLLISPDHGILIDGALIPAKLLVNNASITREMVEAVEYFHIECETHAIILAEGLTVETYLDTGNRAAFDNAGMALLLHPLFEINSSAKCWDDACAPLRTDRAFVEAVWRELARRAADLGYFAAPVPELTGEARIRLVAQGRELRPVTITGARYIYALPPDLTEVTLSSRMVHPEIERPWAYDDRQLGIAVREIVVRGDAGTQILSADHPSLRRGWWRPENDGVNRWRWTDGAGIIPLPFAARLIEVEIAMTALYPVEPGADTERRAA